ncbi:MAG: hypothetical protein ACE10H_16850 [Candidatus Binatia bacterium]
MNSVFFKTIQNKERTLLRKFGNRGGPAPLRDFEKNPPEVTFSIPWRDQLGLRDRIDKILSFVIQRGDAIFASSLTSGIVTVFLW